MAHPYPIREIARQSGLSEATVDRVLNKRPGVRASTAANVAQAITDLDRQRSQLRLNGRTFIVESFVTVVTGGADIFVGAAPAAAILAAIKAALTAWHGQLFGQIGLLVAVIVVIRLLPGGLSGWLKRS